jgi:hypothetical protein
MIEQIQIIPQDYGLWRTDREDIYGLKQKDFYEIYRIIETEPAENTDLTVVGWAYSMCRKLLKEYRTESYTSDAMTKSDEEWHTVWLGEVKKAYAGDEVQAMMHGLYQILHWWNLMECGLSYDVENGKMWIAYDYRIYKMM